MAKKKGSKNPPARGALHDRLRTRVHADRKKQAKERLSRDEAREIAGRTGRRTPAHGAPAGTSNTDPRVDAYIARAPGYARPLLEHLRALVHRGCPEVRETIKWGAPYFEHQGVLCGMAAFKNHCALVFWNEEVVFQGRPGAMGQFGRIAALSDLPEDDDILGYVRGAARLNEAGVKRPSRSEKEKEPLRVPADLRAALAKNPAARDAFEGFSPTHKREYVEWITGAKREETRSRRLATALAWMAEGKPRNWKYTRRPAAS